MNDENQAGDIADTLQALNVSELGAACREYADDLRSMVAKLQDLSGKRRDVVWNVVPALKDVVVQLGATAKVLDEYSDKLKKEEAKRNDLIAALRNGDEKTAGELWFDLVGRNQ